MKNKSLSINAILNTIKQFFAILFPLITIPYVSRILEEENYGKFNFANSIVSYFALLAGLGVSSYAVREGARFRKNQTELKKFVDEVYTINILSTVASYILLGICLLISVKLHSYFSTIIILSGSIICTSIGCEWINAIHEDYSSLTIEYIIMHIFAIIFLFNFVKTSEDVDRYAMVMAISTGGANIINCIYVNKEYGGKKFKLSRNLIKHIIPIAVLFFNTLAVTIYVNSDVTMLGFIKTDREVGIYSIASKIYLTVKQILNATIAVSVPRLSAYIGNRKEKEYENLLQDMFQAIMILLLPICIGMCIFAPNMIMILSTEGYLEGITTLRILSVSMFFSVIASFFFSCIALPLKRDQDCLKASIISAISNILLNIVLIPMLSYNGAAITTLIAELLVGVILYLKTRDSINLHVRKKEMIILAIANIILVIACYIIKKMFLGYLFQLIFSFLTGGAVYFIILILLKEEVLYKHIKEIFYNSR